MKVWESLMAKIKEANGKITKGEIVMLKGKLIADFKSGHKCTDLFAD